MALNRLEATGLTDGDEILVSATLRTVENLGDHGMEIRVPLAVKKGETVLGLLTRALLMRPGIKVARGDVVELRLVYNPEDTADLF